MNVTLTARERIEADLRRAMADLAALPARRRWDIEAKRAVLKARVERLLDDLLGCET